MLVMAVRHVRMTVAAWLVPVPVTVCADRHHVVDMIVVAVVVPMGMLVLDPLVLVLVAVRLRQMEQDACQHQGAPGQEQSAA
jgi:uncharacterized protein YybS (DUF2232 family)